MSLRCQTGAALWASQYPGLGATGAAIKAASATGEHGAGIAINDSLADASEYTFEVVQQPSGGTVTLTELGQSTLTTTSDGVFVWSYRLREDGVYVGTQPTTVTVLVGLALAATACQVGMACATGAVSLAPPGLALAAAACSMGLACATGAVSLAPPGLALAAAACSVGLACATGVVQVTQSNLAVAAAACLVSLLAGTGAVLLERLGDGIYCSIAGMTERFGNQELAQLTDPVAGVDINITTLGRALADADAEVNARIGRRYALPLASIPAVLTRVAADIARYYLWDARATDQVRNRYKDAIAFLDKIASGEIQVLAGVPLVAPTPAAGAVAVLSRSPNRVFSSDLLDAYSPLGRR